MTFLFLCLVEICFSGVFFDGCNVLNTKQDDSEEDSNSNDNKSGLERTWTHTDQSTGKKGKRLQRRNVCFVYKLKCALFFFCSLKMLALVFTAAIFQI